LHFARFNAALSRRVIAWLGKATSRIADALRERIKAMGAGAG
jgi:hypothetical protein